MSDPLSLLKHIGLVEEELEEFKECTPRAPDQIGLSVFKLEHYRGYYVVLGTKPLEKLASVASIQFSSAILPHRIFHSGYIYNDFTNCGTVHIGHLQGNYPLILKYAELVAFRWKQFSYALATQINQPSYQAYLDRGWRVLDEFEHRTTFNHTLVLGKRADEFDKNEFKNYLHCLI